MSNYKSSSEQDSSIKACYTKYTNVGDAICFSRRKGIKCGFCNTNKICVPGTSKGALDGLCDAENYTFGKVISNQIDICSRFKKSKQCKGICQWDSNEGVCQQKHIDVLPELNVLLQNSQENSQADEKTSSKKYSSYLLYVGIAFLAICIAVLSFFVWRNYRGGKLFKMSSVINLDELPSVNH